MPARYKRRLADPGLARAWLRKSATSSLGTSGDAFASQLRSRPYLREAAAREDSPTLATLEALQADVLNALDDDFAPRTDVRTEDAPRRTPASNTGSKHSS